MQPENRTNGKNEVKRTYREGEQIRYSRLHLPHINMTGFVNAFLKLVRGLKETILNFFKPTVAQLYLLFIFAQKDLNIFILNQ